MAMKRGRQPIDMLGQRHGRLTVVSEAGRSPAGEALWRCLCDCGKEKIIAGRNMRDGMTTSCGCAQAEAAKRANLKRMSPLNREFYFERAELRAEWEEGEL